MQVKVRDFLPTSEVSSTASSQQRNMATVYPQNSLPEIYSEENTILNVRDCYSLFVYIVA
jgi:hypothetical protein